jgi:hypothetical protein
MKKDIKMRKGFRKKLNAATDEQLTNALNRLAAHCISLGRRQQARVSEYLRLQEAIAAFHKSGVAPAHVGEELLRQFRTMLSDNDLEELLKATPAVRGSYD